MEIFNTYLNEAMITTGIVGFISFCLFLFWVKKKALLNFQAWALLTTIINIVLTINYSPVKRILPSNLNGQTILLLMFIQFLATVVTLFQSWKISEKYLLCQPPISKRNKKQGTKKAILVRGTALWNTVKNGGNNEKNLRKVRKNIKNLINKQYA